MRPAFKWSFLKYTAFALLLAYCSNAAAQSAADQSFKAIPQQVKESAENKATVKTNTVSNNAMDNLDSVSGKALRGFTNLFRRKGNSKNKNQKPDSTGIHATDTAAAPLKSTSRVSPGSFPNTGMRMRKRVSPGLPIYAYYKPCCLAIKNRNPTIFSKPA